MSFRVLRADGADEHDWLDILRRYPPELRDLHYTPAYGRIYRDTYGYEPMLAVLERDGQVAIHAFVRRPLDEMPFLAGAGVAGRYADVATPYGFGGPLLSQPEHAYSIDLLRDFDAAWRAWCIAEVIPAEFVCLHPLLGNAAGLEASGIVAPVATKDVVVIDLRLPEERLWSEISRGTRSSIRRAGREGVEVAQVVPDREALEAFQRMYLATMARVGAASRWLFPAAYFHACVERLGDEGSALFFARCRGELAAAYLLICDERTAYYHFGASDERWFALRPNNLLMYETLLWAKRRGCARYHLGGGVTASGNDSLLRFKSSFGGHEAPLYTYGRILHEGVYHELCELKRAYEVRQNVSGAAPDYFPLYRR
jgi:hypothetical protein